MIPRRWIPIGVLVVVLVAVIVVVRSGGGAHEYKLTFDNAGQLVNGDQLQVGGVPVGKIKAIDLTSDNRAQITVTVDEPYAPLHAGTTAEIRATSLSGVANRFIQLRLGANNTPEIPDGGSLGATKTTGITDVDQLFNTFDPKTREALKQVVKGFGTQFDGAEQAVRSASKYFGPSLQSTDQVFAELVRDQNALGQFIDSTGETMTALAARKGTITDLVSNASQAFSATAAERQALQEGLAKLPGTLRAGTGAFDALHGAMPELRRLVAVSKPATKDLEPFMNELRSLLDTSGPALKDLNVALDSPGSSDLAGATAKLPAFARVAGPSSQHGREALSDLVPILQFVAPYAPDLASAVSTFGEAGSFYDANGHYVRATATFNDYQWNDDGKGGPGVLTPNPPTNALAGVQTGVTRRCPGGATQPAGAGSIPSVPGTTATHCDPSSTPPGP
jgi:phospholipid/cholesterol/gamma-HCH transport system substrate-binding protein